MDISEVENEEECSEVKKVTDSVKIIVEDVESIGIRVEVEIERL